MTPETPVRRLWGAVLCGYLALGATLQELPGYLTDRFHGGPAAIGLAVGIAFAATALARPLAGLLGDRGRSRPVVVTGAALTTLGAFGHLVAPSVGAVLAARLVMGAGEAALFSGALPWVLAGMRGTRRGGRVAGWFGLSMWAGLALGPLVAVAAHRAGGYPAAWWTVAALPVVSMALVLSTRPAPRTLAPTPASWRELVPSGVGRPGLCLGLAAYGYGSLSALLVLYLAGSRLGGDSVALTAFASAFLLARTVGSPLVDRYGGAPVAAVTLAVEAIGLALLAAATSLPVALAATAVAGAGVGVVYPATAAMTLRRAGRSPGLAMGTMTSLWDLGILAAGPLSGLLAAHLGFRPAFAVAAGAAALAVPVTRASSRPANSATAGAGESARRAAPPRRSAASRDTSPGAARPPAGRRAR